VALALLIALGTCAFPPHTASPACPTTLSLTLLNDPYILVDSNNPVSGPQVVVAYATLTNTGSATASSAYMYIGNGTTPGTFAPGSDGQSLSMLGSVADATRFIVNLAPGESRTAYWMLKYPLTDGETYPMTIWASNADGCFVQGSHNYTTQKTISAAANKMLGVVTLDPPDGQVRVGNILTATVTGFNFGVIGSNGDAWLQPVGNPDFNPDHFRLIRTEVYIHSIENHCGYGSMPYIDRLYFPGIRSCYTFNAADYVKYYFVAASEGTTTAQVYQQAASGKPEKYSIDYGTAGATVTFTAHCGGMLLGKSVTPQTATANTTLTWTITYRNESDSPMGDPGSGNGLTVREGGIPANTTYVANSTACSGSCITYFSTDNGVTWTTTEPAPSNVTRIKWFINEAIPAHSTGWVSFQSKVNSDVTGTPLICNNASAGVADCPFDPIDIVCANGGADLDILKVVDDKSPCQGSEITYVVTVSNPSTTNATGVQVTDLLPSGLTHLSSSTSQGTYNNVTRVWNVGSLNASTNATLTLTARVNAGTAGTTIINSANITHADQIDPVLLNNSDHDGITVHPAPAAYPASNSPVYEGSTIYLFGGPGGMTSYYWTGPGGWTSSDPNPIRTGATAVMAGTYNLTIVDYSGCGSASNTTEVVVNAKSETSNTCMLPECMCRGLMISSTEGGSVTTPGEGEFSYVVDTVVDLVASPDPGYKFVNWSGDVSSIADIHDASTNVTMYEWYSITANFEPEGSGYSLTISSTEGGSVIAPGQGTYIHAASTVVELVAQPSEGYQFMKWTGDVSTIAGIYAASTTITMNADYSITANFQAISPIKYRLTLSGTTGGSVTSPGEGTFTYDEGTVVTLVATPDPGYRFTSWLGDVDNIANVNSASTTITMDANYFITGAFKFRVVGGCFIATAAYGTPTAEQIDMLREFRDVVLLESDAGSRFVALYYQLSPPVAEFIAGNELLRTLVRELLVDPFVWVVEATGEMWRN
jgi:uncharacterized repeat protein (TIGR01451 family)